MRPVTGVDADRLMLAGKAPERAGQIVEGSTTVLVVVAILIGVIFGFLAGILHKRDGSSVLAAIIRAASAACGGATLCLAICFSSDLLLTLIVLLVAVIFGIGMTILHYADGKTGFAAVWCGGVAFVAIATLGNGVLALYERPPAQPDATVRSADVLADRRD